MYENTQLKKYALFKMGNLYGANFTRCGLKTALNSDWVSMKYQMQSSCGRL